MNPLPKANRKYANEKEDSDDSNAKESSSNKSGKGSGGKSKAAKKETDNKKNAPPTANSRKDFHEAFKSVLKQITRVGEDTFFKIQIHEGDVSSASLDTSDTF